MTASFTDRLALSPVTIPQCAFADSFGVIAEAGFRGIGLRYNLLEDFLAGGGTLGEVRSLLRQHGLCFSEGAFLAEWQFNGGAPVICKRRREGGPSEARDVLMRRLRQFMERCAELECVNITAVPALYQTGDLALAAEEFGALCDLARGYGLNICLEFIAKAPQVNSMKTAHELIAAAGRANGGLVVDTFLFHESGSRLADLAAVPLERIFNVQLADAKALPREQLNMLADRLYPGEGVAPVRDIVLLLARGGYTGFWTVEIFNPDYARLPPSDVARRAYDSAATILRAAIEESAA
jgi:2-keto-myo-inositol isomerase